MPRKQGRPKKVWDEEDQRMFKTLCSMFCTEAEICSVMNVDDKTLVRLINRHLYEDITGHQRRGTAKPVTFTDAFEKYSSTGKMALRRAQYNAAINNGNVTMMIWLGKQYLDQTDVVEATVAEVPTIVDDLG